MSSLEHGKREAFKQSRITTGTIRNLVSRYIARFGILPVSVNVRRDDHLHCQPQWCSTNAEAGRVERGENVEKEETCPHWTREERQPELFASGSGWEQADRSRQGHQLRAIQGIMQPFVLQSIEHHRGDGARHPRFHLSASTLSRQYRKPLHYVKR